MGKKITWATARCPECGREYQYPQDDHKPATCGQYECIRRHLHPELSGKDYRK